jgi:trans-2,3-dihydro-3-hydroxyanthranilate isomerase
VARRRRVTWLDVFTDRPLTGNGLAVVHDADDLDAPTMLAAAREARQSETTFVQAPSAAGPDYRNRIFTTLGELPFAGHPSLGTAVAVARERGATSARYVQETPAGRQPVEVELAGDLARASMLQEPAVFGPQLDAAEVLAAAGLDAAHAHPAWAPQVVSTGVPHVVAPVAALGDPAPRRPALAALLAPHGAVCLFLAQVDPERGTAAARSFFLDPAGVLEDPATGSAAGPLLALLHARARALELVVEQGVAMGRPSRLEASVEGDRVRVGGDVVVLADAHARF